MSERKKLNFASFAFFYSADEWNEIDLTDDETPLVGDATRKIIRFGTKNIIEAPEKSFKTTFFQRFALGLSCGKTVYREFPVTQKCRVLYFHGELTPAELAERRNGAIRSIPGFTGENYIEGRSVKAHFITPEGQEDIKKHVAEHKPKDDMPYVVIFDPWQAFITGFDENSFKDMSRATKFLDELMVANRCTVFIQMHEGKDPAKGARGHSSIAGWKDTTIKLMRKNEINLLVKVKPRWDPPFEFGLTFRNGTLHEKDIFTPQSQKIRKLVEMAGGKISKPDIMEVLGVIGGSAESIRQAIHRAQTEKAIMKTGDGDISLPWEEFSWNTPEL